MRRPFRYRDWYRGRHRPRGANIRSVTTQPNAHVRFRRAIERRALWMAEDAARELPNLRLEDALQLVRLYAEQESPKFEKAAMRWLERYLTESAPRLRHFAEIAIDLAKLEPRDH